MHYNIKWKFYLWFLSNSALWVRVQLPNNQPGQLDNKSLIVTFFPKTHNEKEAELLGIPVCAGQFRLNGTKSICAFGNLMESPTGVAAQGTSLVCWQWELCSVLQFGGGFMSVLGNCKPQPFAGGFTVLSLFSNTCYSWCSWIRAAFGDWTVMVAAISHAWERLPWIFRSKVCF